MNEIQDNYSRRMLLKIMKEKVVTETDMIKAIGCNKRQTDRIQAVYKNLVRQGFPVVRRQLDVPGWTSRRITEGARQHVNHRLVIYYIDVLKGGLS